MYEKLCNKSEAVLAIRPPVDQYAKLEKAIQTAHLQITPIGATSFATMVSVFLVFISILIGALTYLAGSMSIFIPLILILTAALTLTPLSNLPIYLADKWRLKASNQMVLCMLYIVIYMRHTSNLEHAIKFSALHINPPLSLDLRKIFWDVESGKYSTIKEALDIYLETWRDYNLEFVNSFHLVESSLYEPSDSRRLELLDKSLDIILDGTYEKMLHYAQELKNPITMLHMLGIILPILGLVIFPLIAAFMGKYIRWYHVAILYNVLLPIFVFTYGYEILSKRPTGYGESNLQNVLMNIKKSLFFPVFITLIFLIIGFSPLIIHSLNPNVDIPLGKFLGNFLDFKCNGECGPFGLGSLLISLFVPLGLALGIGTYYKKISKDLIKIRNETKKLENEFASSLFQLGNRLADGVPAELAFGTVANNMSGTPTGNFFRLVFSNITNLGLNIKEAIFSQKVGAIMQYPSSLIESSMEVLLESIQKGSKIAAQSMISISTYISEIHRVNERLNDLLSEIVSSMKSQISFMAPVIAGIVVGIGSMIVGIIANMTTLFSQVGGNQTETTGISSVASFASIFNISEIIPSYYFQLVVGIYVIEIIIILTILANGIENGSDKLNQDYLLGKNTIFGGMLYVIIAGVVITLFNLLSSTILSSTGFGVQ
ncbi:hypothetical protein J4404_01150 [Candidatus Woesearchaeota archaeon]|nr:hypothetical protein [Candidatus Woesearchaeota archaeon]